MDSAPIRSRIEQAGDEDGLLAVAAGFLRVPALAEIVLEGHIYPQDPSTLAAVPAGAPHRPDTGYEMALEGPFGDHTGYYNEQDWFPVFTVDRITMRRDPIYHSTYTGKPPDEPAVLGVALGLVIVADGIQQEIFEAFFFKYFAKDVEYTTVKSFIYCFKLGEKPVINLALSSFFSDQIPKVTYLLLADAVNTAETLFKPVGIPRQIVVHH